MPFEGGANTVGRNRIAAGSVQKEQAAVTLASGAVQVFTPLRVLGNPRISALINLTAGPVNQLGILLEFRQTNQAVWRRLLAGTFTNALNAPQLFEIVWSCYSVRLTCTAPAIAGNYTFVSNLSAVASS